jgi:hypothetical protein
MKTSLCCFKLVRRQTDVINVNNINIREYILGTLYREEKHEGIAFTYNLEDMKNELCCV